MTDLIENTFKYQHFMTSFQIENIIFQFGK